MSNNNRYYVILPGRGRNPGIYDNWSEAESQTKGFPNGRAYRFDTYDEAFAFWQSGGQASSQEKNRVVIHWDGRVLEFPLLGMLYDFLHANGFLKTT